MTVAQAILLSQESATDETQALYQTFLHRAADSAGLVFFSAALQQGASVDAVIVALVGSAEYLGRV
jgi:hypothetical protein